MITVKIELDKHGKGEEKTLIGLVCIANDGKGTVKYGNYNYALSHAGKYLNKKKGVYKSGRVRKFNRKHSPYHLLLKVLKDALEDE